MKPVIVAADMVTPYGTGTDACWNGLLAGKSAISRVNRFRTATLQSDFAGIIDGLRYREQTSLVVQMLQTLFQGVVIPEDAKLLLATTKGEVDLLEQSIIGNKGDASGAVVGRLLDKVSELSGARGGEFAISAACTSSSAAAAQAGAMIRNNNAECVLVVACDSVTEFIFSGFSALMALDKQPARPFDRNRAGLNVGEAAAYVLVMAEERAVREQRPVLGTIAGWGLSDDANHMTGPCRASEGLILAITKALKSACVNSGSIGFISAHGTGTLYNDEMEMRAFRAVFEDGPIPVYSVKGGIGHTMGCAGLIEMIIALRSLRNGTVPGTVNLHEPDEDAAGWVSDKPQQIREETMALMTNAGFSGINTALVLEK